MTRYFFFEDDFFVDFFDDRFLGTFAPSLRASDKPIAIACLRLVTFLPERPLFSVPSLRSCIARSTFFEAFLLYFGIPSLHGKVLDYLDTKTFAR